MTTAFEQPIEVFIAMAFGALAMFIIGRIFRSVDRQDTFISKTECEKIRSSCPSSKATTDLNQFKAEMRESLGVIKGVLLAIASKSGVPVADYEDLVKK